MSFEVPKKLERQINRLVKNYPEKRSASLMVLHALQDEFGHISVEAQQWAAAKLNLQPINIHELVTFYPMLREHDPGKTVVRVCRTLSCALAGSARLHRHICQRLGLEAMRLGCNGQRTAGSESSTPSAWPVAAPGR